MWILILEVFLIGVSLAMDAFAVSITDGMCYGDLNKKKGVTIPLTFGLFQAGMPLLGFFLGSLFISYIETFDHFIAFALLFAIGGKMVIDGIKEAKGESDEVSIKKYSFPEVFVQGIATSIDALAVGISMISMVGITTANIWGYVALIGVTTFAISTVGLLIGIKVGKLFKDKVFIAEIIGGLVLVAIGAKILIEGLL